MKLVKKTNSYLIYQLSEKEMNSEEVDNGYEFLIFSKEWYEDSKPTFRSDLGCEEMEADSLEEAIEWTDRKEALQVKPDNETIQEVLDFANALKEVAKASKKQNKEYLITNLEQFQRGLQRMVEEMK